MRKRTKIVLSIVLIVVAIFIGVNTPIIPITHCYGTTFVSYLDSLHPLCDGFVTLDAMQPNLRAGSTASLATNATSNLTIPLNNGGCKTYVQAISLSGANLTSAINNWSMTGSSNGVVNLYSANTANTVLSCSETTLTLYPVSSGSPQIITHGESVNYLIVFANGDSISGTVVAQ